jgi:hypothetical protein
VWQKIAAQSAPDGTTTWVTNTAYVELASGMHYWDNGVLRETEELIVPYPSGAVATNGPHKVIFAPNLATVGAIDMQTADGLRLTSHVVGLSYLDTQSGKVAVIANIKDCVGQIVGANQVIYSDAFSGVQADVRYSYRRSGLEQDVILRSQPPGPEQYGMNPDTTLLTVFSEFVNSPTPRVSTAAATGDQTLDFGSTRFVPGRAFAMDAGAADSISVVKKWVVVNGRTFLFEEVPFRSAQQQLKALLQGTASSSGPSKVSIFARVEDIDLPVLPAAKEKHPLQALPKVAIDPQVAMGNGPSRGFVMDYATMGTSVTNFTFQSDTTYYITGPVNLVGTNYIEGGAIIKYTNYSSDQWSAGANLTVGGSSQLIFKTAPYRPAVFTSKDDDTVGEIISGSTGNPSSSYYGFAAVNFQYGDRDIDVHDVRVDYAYFGLAFFGGPAQPLVRNSQFVGDNMAVYSAVPATWRNLLADSCYYALNSWDGTAVNVEHVTVSRCNTACNHGIFNVTNCLFAAVTWVATTNVPTTVNDVNCATNLSGTNVFQTVGAGADYLAAGSPYRNAGTTNISPAVWADLKKKTTYPPLVCTNVLYASPVTLSPQALRDTDMPDLGYHYDPVDYLVDLLMVTNAPLTIAKGTVVASLLNNGGIWLQDSSSITAAGTADQPVQLTFYNTVQEQPLFLSAQARSNFNYAVLINPYHAGVTVPYGPQGLFQFTKYTALPGSGIPFDHTKPNWDFSTLTVQNSEFGNFAYSGMSPGSNTVSVFMNNLFVRSRISFQAWKGANMGFTNNLFWGSASISFSALQATVSAVNNVFDSTTVGGNALLGGVFSNNFNAYLNCPGTVPMAYAGPNYVIQTNSLAWQSGPLGNFYQPTNSILMDAGSTNANLIGLSPYTTTTNQVSEGISTVDIGYHYVALDVSGNPLDSNGDGIPDYINIDASGLPAGWVIQYFGISFPGPNTDPDGDGLTNLQEYLFGTNPLVSEGAGIWVPSASVSIP